jgi:hypothetical protein
MGSAAHNQAKQAMAAATAPRSVAVGAKRLLPEF